MANDVFDGGVFELHVIQTRLQGELHRLNGVLLSYCQSAFAQHVDSRLRCRVGQAPSVSPLERAPARDELQEVIAFLRSEDFGVELQFGNYR